MRNPHAIAGEQPLDNGYWVLPGRWFAGEHPAARTAEETRERLDRLLAAGIDFFVDLTVPGEFVEYSHLLPPNVVHVRKSLPDHGVPEDAEEMTDILETIDVALTGGRRIYLHCRAGIGRTGMTVGCYLASGGRRGGEALDELNRLWQQSARSAVWPTVPETQKQIEYVEQWALRSARSPPPRIVDEELDLAALTAAKRLRERFHGLLLGLAIGDALAAATQYRKPGSFQPVGDLLGGGPFDLPRGAWTDDTAMALCLAQSLVTHGGFDARDQTELYVRWQQQGYLSATGQCVGITASVSKALATAKWRRVVFAGSHDPRQLDKELLSRVGPAVMFRFASAPEAIDLAAEAARTTCQAPVALETCRLFAAMLHAALSGRPKAEILARAPAEWSTREPAPALAALAVGSYRGKDAAQLQPSGSIIQSLETALWAFAGTTSFRLGALAVANLGGDSDANTAAYGQLAGAFYGVSAIPGVWRNSLIRKDLIDELADRLLAEALIGLGGPD